MVPRFRGGEIVFFLTAVHALSDPFPLHLAQTEQRCFYHGFSLFFCCSGAGVSGCVSLANL